MKYLIMILIGLVVFSYADAPIYGYFWLRYTYENPTTPEVEENAHFFSIERGYVRWKTSTSPVAVSGTIDFSQKEDATSASDWNVRLKYAQADWTLPGISKSIPDAKLMLGLQKIYFGIIGLWEYPLIEKSMEEVEGKMNSADLGLSFYGLIPAGYGEFDFQLFNGNGYTHVTENNTNKALCGDLSLIPLPGVMLKGSIWYAKKPQETDSITIVQADQNRYVGVLQIKRGPVTVSGEYLMTRDYETDGMGYSGFAEVALNRSLSLLGRYDFFDPNTDEDNNGHNLIIGGINWFVSPVLLIQTDYQIKSYENEETESTDKVMVQCKYSY